MIDPDFRALAEHLAGDVRQPDFGSLRERRRRRTRRLAAAVTAGVVAAVLIATGLLTLVRPALSTHPPVPGSSPTAGARTVGATVEVGGGPVPGRDGTLYATARQQSPAAPGAQRRAWLVRSTDLGAHWTSVTELSWLSADYQLELYGGPAGLWIFNRATVRLAYSADDGRTFRTWERSTVFPEETEYDVPIIRTSPDGATLWARVDTRVVRLDGPTGTPTVITRPAGGTAVSLVPLAADRALLQARHGAAATWYLTGDAGATWSPVADPCAGTSHPGTDVTWGQATAAGVWMGCGGQPIDGVRSTDFVSSPDGYSWHARGTDASTAAGDLVPVSATVAWRFGALGAAYRMDDGQTWAAVTISGAVGQLPPACVALDPARLVCLDALDGFLARVHWTQDGGAHWTSATPAVN